VQTSQADLIEQHELLLAVRDKVSAIHAAVLRLRAVREQAEGWRKRLGDHPAALAACDRLLADLDAVADTLYLPGDHKMTYGLIVRPRLNQALASVLPVIATADAKPTVQVRELVDFYFGQIDAQLATLEALLANGVAEVNRIIGETGLPPVGI
jgi:hypothetical protein